MPYFFETRGSKKSVRHSMGRPRQAPQGPERGRRRENLYGLPLESGKELKKYKKRFLCVGLQNHETLPICGKNSEEKHKG